MATDLAEFLGGLEAVGPGVGVGAQQVHQPAVFFRVRDIRAGGVHSFQGNDAVQRLHEVGEDPGAAVRRGGEPQLAVALEGGIGKGRVFALIEEHLEVAHGAIVPRAAGAVL